MRTVLSSPAPLTIFYVNIDIIEKIGNHTNVYLHIRHVLNLHFDLVHECVYCKLLCPAFRQVMTCVMNRKGGG